MKRWEDERQRVPYLDEDVRDINEQLLLIASDPTIGKRALRLLQASSAVSRLLENADSSAIGTAIRCGIPLITFLPTVSDLLCSEPRSWRPKAASDVPEKLQDLMFFSLTFARQLAQSKPVMAQGYFRLTLSAAENLAVLAVFHLKRMSRQFGMLLRLREGDQEQIWEDILVGQRATGALAFQIAQEAAGLSLLGTHSSTREGAIPSNTKPGRAKNGTQGNGSRGR
jgi:hypothetical protein